MVHPLLTHTGHQRLIALAGAFMALAVVSHTPVTAQQNNNELLHIGSSGTLTVTKPGSEDNGDLSLLRSFIKDETGLDNDIERQKDWRELAEKMAKGQLQVGVFQGVEFAWAKEQYPDLKPLALAVNITRYPSVYVVTLRRDQANDFAALQGQSLGLPNTGQLYLRLFLDHECQTVGKDSKSFFSKNTSEKNTENALDDVVDGIVQATVVDRPALEEYKQNKPGRFGKLKEIAKSQPFPPVVIACYDKVLDDATQQRFREGLLKAATKEKGRSMMISFHLTGFDAVPDDFAKLLENTRKAYPPPPVNKK